MDWDWDREIAERGFLEAARRGDADRVLELLDGGMDIDARDSIGWTALMAATAGRHVDLMAKLLARGAGLDFINSFHYTAMTLATVVRTNGWGGQPDPRPFDLLVAAGASLTLHEAVYLCDLDLARQRLEAGDDPNTAEGCYQGPILMKAADDGNLTLVDLLLDFGANVEAMDDLGRRPLLSAAGHGQTKVVRRLLDRGAELDVRDWGGHTALAEAAKGGHGELARWLIDRGAKRGVVDALFLDDLPVLVDLLDEAILAHAEELAVEPIEPDLAEDDPSKERIRPSTVDQIYLWGGRLAMQAASRGSEAAVALLLDRGASPLIDRETSSILVGIDDHSLLAEAAQHGHLAVIRLLLDRGANLHAVGKDGLTPLAWALQQNQAEAAALLRSAGATR